jgi:hypothetical protein
MQTPMADLVKEHGSINAAARVLGIHRTSLRDRLRTEQARAAKAFAIAAVPDDTEPVETIIDRRCTAFTRQKAKRDAERWLPITVNEMQPFGLLVFGDEHADDNNCDWPELKRDLKLCRDTDGLYACAVGDATNNWVGRLMREYADQSVTRKESRQLLKWLLSEDAAPWLFRLIGNHDKWNEGDVIIGLFADSAYHIADWEARIELRTADGQAFRVHASHNFKGNSIYNKTHGPSRAAMFSGGAADLYLCGHLHTLGTQSFEIEETGKLVHVVRARGYKKHDMYAVTNGYAEGEAGASVFVLFNPQAETPAGRITIFNDPVLGAKVLTALRADMGKPCTYPKGRVHKTGKSAHDHRNLRPGRGGKEHRGKADSKALRGKSAPVRHAAKADAKRARRR